MKITPEKPRDRKNGALRRLGVTDLELKAAPDISSLLKRSKGGLKSALEAMRFSPDPNVMAFLDRYDAVPAGDRKSLRWEAIALAAGVSPVHLLGGAVLAIQAYSANAVKIIALSHHPEVMTKRIEFALRPGGERDRTAVQTGLGFLPTVKGSTFIINPTNRAEVVEKDDEPDEVHEDDDLNHLFPSLSKTQEELVPVRARMLETGS